MEILFCVLIFVVGAIFGSFLCCQAHRLRRHEKGMKPLGSRSVCLNCKHQLRWYENLPLISWLVQRGKCRHCGKKIGAFEIISELGTALAFLIIAIVFLNTSMGWPVFLATLVFTLSLAFLAMYDGKWGELPVPLLTFSAICAIIMVILRIWSFFSSPLDTTQTATSLMLALDPVSGVILAPLLSATFFGGLYLLLYLVSKGRWVGDGDWILASIIGLALGQPFLALIALFVANLSACLVMAPLVRKRKDHKIYFGPFLVIGFIITVFVASML